MRHLIYKSYNTIRYIPLTQGKFAIVHKNIYDEVSKYKWYAHKIGRTYYAAKYRRGSGRKNKKVDYMHRFIWELTNGPIPEDKEIDHDDRNGINNLLSNLKLLSHQRNMCNQRKRENCSSKYKGICWSIAHNKWKAEIQVHYKKIHLGYSDSEIEAARAYDHATIKYRGKYAKTNFPLSDYI